MLLRFNIFHLIVCDLRTRIIIFPHLSSPFMPFWWSSSLFIRLPLLLYSYWAAFCFSRPYFLARRFIAISFSFSSSLFAHSLCLILSLFFELITNGCIATDKASTKKCLSAAAAAAGFGFILSTWKCSIWHFSYFLFEGFAFFPPFCRLRIISFLYHFTILHLLDMSDNNFWVPFFRVCCVERFMSVCGFHCDKFT